MCEQNLGPAKDFQLPSILLGKQKSQNVDVVRMYLIERVGHSNCTVGVLKMCADGFYSVTETQDSDTK